MRSPAITALRRSYIRKLGRQLRSNAERLYKRKGNDRHESQYDLASLSPIPSTNPILRINNQIPRLWERNDQNTNIQMIKTARPARIAPPKRPLSTLKHPLSDRIHALPGASRIPRLAPNSCTHDAGRTNCPCTDRAARTFACDSTDTYAASACQGRGSARPSSYREADWTCSTVELASRSCGTTS